MLNLTISDIFFNKMNTRQRSEHALFGLPNTLPSMQLPTLGDVMKLCWNYKCDGEGKRFQSVNEIVSKASEDVVTQWERCIGDR